MHIFSKLSLFFAVFPETLGAICFLSMYSHISLDLYLKITWLNIGVKPVSRRKRYQRTIVCHPKLNLYLLCCCFLGNFRKWWPSWSSWREGERLIFITGKHVLLQSIQICASFLKIFVGQWMALLRILICSYYITCCCLTRDCPGLREPMVSPDQRDLL